MAGGKMKLQRVVVDTAALADLRRSKEMRDVLDEHADRALRSLGSHYHRADYSFPGKGGRAVVRVSAVDAQGKQENLESNTIIKAVFGG